MFLKNDIAPDRPIHEAYERHTEHGQAHQRRRGSATVIVAQCRTRSSGASGRHRRVLTVLTT
eukprot:SAG31_NODE_33326_length_345_cov_0.731707_1_plen_61_part_10